MLPCPSLHYVATLLDQRRRRHHRVRRLWSIGLLLLGLGLPLVGWWGTCRLAPRAAPPAAARAGAVEPTRPAGTRGISLEPRGEHPAFLELQACHACPCLPRAPGQAVCTPSDGVDLGCPLLPGCVPEPSGGGWERLQGT